MEEAFPDGAVELSADGRTIRMTKTGQFTMVLRTACESAVSEYDFRADHKEKNGICVGFVPADINIRELKKGGCRIGDRGVSKPGYGYWHDGDTGHMVEKGVRGYDKYAGQRYGSGDTIRARVDYNAQTIEFFHNGTSLGVAFTGISQPLLPAVNMADAGDTVTLVDSSAAIVPAASSGRLDLLTYWTSVDGVSLVVDQFRLQEFQELVTKTWRVKYTRDRGKGKKVPSGARVMNVLRVENHGSYRRYCEHMAKVKHRRGREGSCEVFPVCTDGSIAKLDQDINEKYLLHGTNPMAADAVARSDFDMDRAGSAVGTMFGPGIYLAENASKSDDYAKEGEGIFMGQCALLVCRAVAGKVFTSSEKADHSGQVLSGMHDAVCGDRLAAVGTFREMIFFDAAGVYCEFIIIYSRVYDEP